MTLLEVNGIARSFRDGSGSRQVLRGVCFDVGAGETVALRGPSGSGKSTLLNILAGILLPDAGEVRFGGTEPPLVVSSSTERRRARFRRQHVGFVFQFFNLVPTLSAAENVLLALRLSGGGDAAAALARLDALGVGERRDDFPGTLSGGEQQRVAIARALASAPALLLADEPTGNLDADNARQVTDALWNESANAGAALVIATHNEHIAARADRVVELT